MPVIAATDDRVNCTADCAAAQKTTLVSTQIALQDTTQNVTQDKLFQHDAAKDDVVVSIYLDNDLFTGSHKDADYTAGLAIAFSGNAVADYPLSVDKGLSWINNTSGISSLYDQSEKALYTYETGVVLFTPKELEVKTPLLNDRPYASLIYLSNTQQNLLLQDRQSWISTLSVGLLGLPVVGGIQNTIHNVLGDRAAEGWENQISHGGELTFKYSLSHQKYHEFDDEHIQFTTAGGMSVGYLTEVFYGGSLRVGVLRTPWWNFNVYTANYAEKSNITLPLSSFLDEFYLVAGANMKLRAYNVFLQGQFRDSVITYSPDEIEPFIYEGWIGFSSEFLSGISLSYIIRMQSNELKIDGSDRFFNYSEFALSYKF